MIRFILSSHGDFAKEALNSAAMIVGKVPENFSYISVADNGKGIESFKEEAEEIAEKFQNEKIILLTDLFGGSPFMTILSVFRNVDYRLISGFNLPMIIEAFMKCNTEMSLDEMADHLIETGKNEGIRKVDRLN